jgi:hypothetical protein
MAETEAAVAQLSFLFWRRSFFVSHLQKVGSQGLPLQRETNESGPGKYSGFWLMVRGGEHSFFPPSPPEIGDWLVGSRIQ